MAEKSNRPVNIKDLTEDEKLKYEIAEELAFRSGDDGRVEIPFLKRNRPDWRLMTRRRREEQKKKGQKVTKILKILRSMNIS